MHEIGANLARILGTVTSRIKIQIPVEVVFCVGCSCGWLGWSAWHNALAACEGRDGATALVIAV